MVYTPAVLKVLPLSFSAGLLVVSFALHCVNNAILSQNPGVNRKKRVNRLDLVNRKSSKSDTNVVPSASVPIRCQPLLISA